MSYDKRLFEIDVDHSWEWSWAQFTPSTNTIQFTIIVVGNVLVSIDYDEDVATSIAVIGVIGTIEMSALLRAIEKHMLHQVLL